MVLRGEPLELLRIASREQEYAAFSVRVYAFWANFIPDFGGRRQQGDVNQPGAYIPNERR